MGILIWGIVDEKTTGVDNIEAPGNWSGRNVDRESADGEESEKGFGEHDDRECCTREQITTAPGLRLERLEKGTGESCTAAEETRERISNLLYSFLGTFGCRSGSDALPSFSSSLAHNIICPIGGRGYPNDGHAVENQITA